MKRHANCCDLIQKVFYNDIHKIEFTRTIVCIGNKNRA